MLIVDVKKDGIEREVNAVDSESKKNLLDDEWIFLEIGLRRSKKVKGKSQKLEKYFFQSHHLFSFSNFYSHNIFLDFVIWYGWIVGSLVSFFIISLLIKISKSDINRNETYLFN